MRSCIYRYKRCFIEAQSEPSAVDVVQHLAVFIDELDPCNRCCSLLLLHLCLQVAVILGAFLGEWKRARSQESKVCVLYCMLYSICSAIYCETQCSVLVQPYVYVRHFTSIGERPESCICHKYCDLRTVSLCIALRVLSHYFHPVMQPALAVLQITWPCCAGHITVPSKHLHCVNTSYNSYSLLHTTRCGIHTPTDAAQAV
jgi:hypothetical protein